VPDYWLVDLQGRAIDVHRHPVGSAFTNVTRYGEDAVLHPLRYPDVGLIVRSVLPSR
jgi:hypothetical protein